MRKSYLQSLITAFICDFYSGIQRGQSVSVFFSPLVVFVSLFDRLLLGFSCPHLFLYCYVILF